MSSKKKCCVLTCFRDASMHRFPSAKKNAARFQMWLSAINNPSLDFMTPQQVYKSKRVCSGHFRPEDYVEKPTVNSRPFLKRDSVPSVNLCPDRSILTTSKQNRLPITEQYYSMPSEQNLPSTSVDHSEEAQEEIEFEGLGFLNSALLSIEPPQRSPPPTKMASATWRCEVCGQTSIAGGDRTFFPWPADTSQRIYWQTCLGIQEAPIDLTKSDLYICSDHFDPMQMIRKNTALRKDAFPKKYDGQVPPPEADHTKMEITVEPSFVKDENSADADPSDLFDDDEIMPEELSMAKLVKLFQAAAKERPSSIAPLVTPISTETRAFSNILIDRQEKYLDIYCKACLRQAELVNMLDANCEGIPVTVMYKTVLMTDITLSQTPQLMCHTCIGLLFQCFKFATMTQRSAEVLQAARERFKYLPPLDDGTFDAKNIPNKYSAKTNRAVIDDDSDDDDKDDIKLSELIKKRKLPPKKKEKDSPPAKKGRRVSSRRASEKAKQASKKIVADSSDSDNNDNFDNDEADPDFEEMAEVKDESPENSEVDEKDEKDSDEGAGGNKEDEDNYCMLCRHQFTNMARHMEKVHRVDWESKSCERKRRKSKKKRRLEKIKIKLETPESEEEKEENQKPGKPQWYKCLKCDIKSRNFKEMFEHLQKMHTNDLDCIFCGTEFDHEIQLMDHLGEHGRCVYCRIHFKAFDSYKEWHEHVTMPRHELVCGICEKTFKTRSGRDTHHKTHLKPDEEIKCPQCPLVYGSSTNLRRHVRTFHEKHSYLCADCGQAFTTLHTLKLHAAKIHQKGSGKESIQCEICGKIFADRKTVQAHEAKHYGKTEICQYCGKFFENVEILKKHVETLNHYLYQCETCWATFKKKTSYINHLMKKHKITLTDVTEMHLERKGFQMIKTKSDYKRAKNDVKAIARRGRPRGTDRPDVKVINGKRHYICLICNKVFMNDSNMQRHKDIHTERKYKCPHCDKSFAQKQGVKKHLPVHSDERPFECKICGKRYKDSCTMYKHRRVHGKGSLIGINSASLNPRRKKLIKNRSPGTESFGDTQPAFHGPDYYVYNA